MSHYTLRVLLTVFVIDINCVMFTFILLLLLLLLFYLLFFFLNQVWSLQVKRRKVHKICITQCYSNIVGIVCYMSGEGSAVIIMYLIRQSAVESRSLRPVI